MGRLLDLLAFWRRRQPRVGRRQAIAQQRLMPSEGGGPDVDATTVIIRSHEDLTRALTTPLQLIKPLALATPPPPSPDSVYVQEWLVGKGRGKRRISDEEDSGYESGAERKITGKVLVKRPRLVRTGSSPGFVQMSTLPSTIWARVIEHLADSHLSPLDGSSIPCATMLHNALEGQAHCHALRRVCKAVPKSAAWRTLVLGSRNMLARVAKMLEANTVESGWLDHCFLTFDFSDEALRASTSSGSEQLPNLVSLVFSLWHVQTLHFVGPAGATRALKATADLARSFTRLRYLRIDGSDSSSLSDHICTVAASCTTLESVHVGACRPDLALRAPMSLEAMPKMLTPSVAKLTTLELDAVPITSYELLALVYVSSGLRALGVTLQAASLTDPDLDGCSTRRALIRAFEAVGRSLRRLRIGESWAEPFSQGCKWDPRSSVGPNQSDDELGVLDEALVSTAALVSLRLDAPGLYTRKLLGVLPFTLESLELRSTPGLPLGIVPADVVQARNAAALFGLAKVTVKAPIACCGEWKKGEAVESLRRMDVEVNVLCK